MTHDPGQPRPDSVGSADTACGLQELEARLLLSASPLAEPNPLEPTSAAQPQVSVNAVGVQTFGIDVSHFQGNINWSSVKNASKDFTYIKATQGVNFIDSKFVSNINGANAAGVLAGGYHFATPYTGGVDDAAAEASDFYNAVSPYLGNGFLRPALDLERGSELSTTVLSNWVHDFMNTFSSLSGGIVPIIYAGTSYATNELNSSVNIYDLWYPRWPSNPDFNNPPAAPGIWSSYDLWQYSSTTSVPGISGNVDGDVFFGDLAAFTTKYAINTTPPPPDDHGDNAATATAIAVPSTTAGVIGTASDSDWFELTLNSGTDYTFSVLDNGMASGELRLYTDTSTLLATDTGPAAGGTLAELTFTPIATGTYYLSVDSSGTGGYDLAVQETDDYGDTIATAAGPVTGFVPGGIQSDGDVDVFFFSAVAGKQYDLRFNDAGIPDGALTLLNSSGFLVAQDSGSSPGGIHAQIQWTATASGVMYVAASANPGSLGDYILTLSESDPLIAGDLDADGFVGITDLNVVLGNWNQVVAVGDLSQGDPSGDGFVGIEDTNVVLGNWNTGTPPLAAAGASQTESTAQSASQPTQTHSPVAATRTERVQGLAIANWQTPGRSAFIGNSSDRYAPAMGLWEQDDEV